MAGILRLESLTRGNTLKQGDKTPLKYKLLDADGEKLNVAGKSATVRLVYPDFLTIGYEKDGLTVAQDDTVTFTIDNVIPSRAYHVEIIVDDQFIFPSRQDESKFTVDKSSLGTDANIIEIVGVDSVARKATGMMKQDEEFIDDMTENVISDSKVQSFAQGIDAKATNALSLSESADTLSKSVQEQFNQVVIEGDSSVEAAQARVDASGQTNPTLKARLDKEHNEVTAQLAQTVKKGQVSINDININLGKITPNMVSDELLAQIAGDAAVNAVPADNSLTTPKFTDKAVTVDKTNFLKKGKNLWDGNYTEGMFVSSLVDKVEMTTTPGTYGVIAKIEDNELYTVTKYPMSNRFRIALINEIPNVNKQSVDTLKKIEIDAISGSILNDVNAKYIFVMLTSNESNPPKVMIEKGVKTLYEEPSVTFVNLGDKSIKEKNLDIDYPSLVSRVMDNELTVDKPKFELGGFWADGTLGDINLTTRVRTDYIPVKENAKIIFIGREGVRGGSVYLFGQDKKIVESSGFVNYYKVPSDGYIKILSGYEDDRAIDDVTVFNNVFRIINPEYSKASNLHNKLFAHRYHVEFSEYGGINGIEGFEYPDIYDEIYYKYARSQHIYVKSGHEIYADGDSGLEFSVYQYKISDKAFIKRLALWTTGPIEIDSDCYIRVIARYTDQRNIYLSDDIHNRIIIEKSSSGYISPEQSPYLCGNFKEVYHPPVFETNLDLQTSQIEDIYGIYDDLINPSSGITRNLLGYGGDSSGVEDTTLPIYEYVIEPPRNQSDKTLPDNSVTILISTGIHGNEKSPVWSTAHFIQQLVKNSEDNGSLSSIRANVTLKVIPIINPGGFNADTRANLRGIDVNRRFGYMQEDVSQGGTAYSELESKLVSDWLIANNDATLFIDFHNAPWGNLPTSDMSYLSTKNERLKTIYSSLIRRMLNVWTDKYALDANNTVSAWVETNDLAGTANEGYHIASIKRSCVLEIASSFDGVLFSNELIECGAYLIVNMVLAVLDDYTRA